MKKITLLYLSSILLFSLSFTSCEAETDFEVLAFQEEIPIDNYNYFPASNGNIYTYSDAQGNSQTLEVNEVSLVNGEKFYEINDFNSRDAWIRKSGSEYELRLQGQAVKTAGYVMQGTFYKGLLFDHNAEVGDVWETIAPYTVAFVPGDQSPVRPAEDYEAIIQSEMIAKDKTKKINGIVYENVVQVKVAITALGKTDTAIYYFADNVGIVVYSEGINNFQLSKYTIAQ